MNPVTTSSPSTTARMTDNEFVPRGQPQHGGAHRRSGGDAPPRHCRMRIPESEAEDRYYCRIPSSSSLYHHVNNGSNSSVKHFSQRRRFAANGDDASASYSSVPRVEQIRNVEVYDRSPTKPERTYSLSLSSSSAAGNAGSRVIRTRYITTSSKEEEKAKQFLKEVEDRKALNSLKAQTLQMADLPPTSQRSVNSSSMISSVIPPPPLDTNQQQQQQRASTTAPPVAPSSLLMPSPSTTTGTGSSMIEASPISTLSTSSRGILHRMHQHQASSRRNIDDEGEEKEEGSFAPSDYFQRHLRNLPAARYSTTSRVVVPIQDPVPTSSMFRRPHARHHDVPPHQHHHHSHCRHSHDDDYRQATTAAVVSPSTLTSQSTLASPMVTPTSPSPSMTSPSPMSPGSSPPVHHHHNHQQHRRPRMLIQVAPGLQATLRSSEETWDAIKNDFYMPGWCLGCQTTLFVIQDAAYILCPECHTVSPMDGTFIDTVNAGVGLGFTYDDLVRWQSEILQENKSNDHRHRA